MKNFLLVLFSLVFLVGCGSSPDEKVNNVVRVLTNGSFYYIVSENKETKELISRSVGSARIFADVESGKPMWAERVNGNWTIHVHGGQDIQGSTQNGKVSGVDVVK